MADESTAWQRHGGQQHAAPSPADHTPSPDQTLASADAQTPPGSRDPSAYQRVGRRAAHQAQGLPEPDTPYQRARRSNRSAPAPNEAYTPQDPGYQRTGRRAARSEQHEVPAVTRVPQPQPRSAPTPKPAAPASSGQRTSSSVQPKPAPRASAFIPQQRQDASAPPKSSAPEPIRRRHKERMYDFVPYRHKKRQRAVLMAALACLLVFNLVKLGGYIGDYASSRRTSDDLRAAYYDALDEETAPPSTTPTAVPLTPTPSPVPAMVVDATPEPAPTQTPHVMLQALPYPGNPYGIISSRFQKVRQQNSDIVGWLTVPGLLDEAVVQRDNSYYLRRDYRGYHNDNGSIFLDESCDLSTRPYTLMLFGHNMKSGAMFGCLRNYENIRFYRSNPFINFDTAYEDGRYVIFAIGTLSQNRLASNYLDIGMLTSLNIEWRETAIAQLKKLSEISTGISVEADDQLLLMITCVEADTERRVVAARRVRDGESEESLQRLATYSITK